MNKNVRIAKELVKIAKNLVATKYDYMTEEIIKENNVVMGVCCSNCKYFTKNGYNDGDCEKLQCSTYDTDVCKNYVQK